MAPKPSAIRGARIVGERYARSKRQANPDGQMPLFLVILNLGRVVTHERFRKWRRIIIFLVFVFAGIASPSPDPLTMLLLGGIVVALV